ncbi:hypothetical protein POV27_08530 [Aureisphaera galaxeae]|uniref:hypothetical protein n=1 Tax=Aureisphaera galaxeae TaxID=1538023 RepID=UPI0023508C1F|nr:hypothetical protein [Aureisphaera galaxeae]MDC8004097.1 hypothetical protein [Aureisphaera galaxeae]
MKYIKHIIIALVFLSNSAISQSRLVSWSQSNIENYTKEMYDKAQKLTTDELLEKNLNDIYWSEVFLTLNASVNNYANNTEYQKQLAKQITNQKETKLEGTSRLIIWDRIISGDIIFEGKGIVIDNDLYKVCGRANQLLQNLTGKNFGNVNINSTSSELESLKKKWLDYLTGKEITEYKKTEHKNSKIEEISSLEAFEAIIISVQPRDEKDRITAQCLKNIYGLDEMPDNPGSEAYCNPDSYSFAYLAMLVGDEPLDKTKDSEYWKEFWNKNKNALTWDDEKGYFVIN